MKSLLDWYVDIVNKPKMQYTIADEVIIWLIPIMVAIGAIILFYVVWKFFSKIADAMKNFANKQCERIAEEKHRINDETDCDVDHGDYDETSDWLDIDP